MSAIEKTFARTNWELLAEQKVALLAAIAVAHDAQQTLHLTGLLNWIDAVQDSAEKDGYAVVFLTEET
jgi:hypothetical protein